MSNAQERRLDDEYESRNDAVSGDVPSGDLKPDNSYNPSSSSAAKGSNEVPVVPDDKTEDPTDISVSNTDAQLRMPCCPLLRRGVAHNMQSVTRTMRLIQATS